MAACFIIVLRAINCPEIGLVRIFNIGRLRVNISFFVRSFDFRFLIVFVHAVRVRG